MGYGNGYSTRYDRGGKRHSNDMVAHVWNAQSEEAGQSNNGNFYFKGATLYSYGNHFVVGYIMPDGVALLNADNYSVSTSGHQSDARGAVKNRRYANVANLTALAGDWKLLPRLADYVNGVDVYGRKAMQKLVRDALLEHASALRATIHAPGESGWRWNDDEGKSEYVAGAFGEVGAYLAKLAGLPAATWPAIARKRVALDEKAAKAAKAKKAADAKALALKLATMPDSTWRELLALNHTRYASHYASIAKQLFHAKRLGKSLGFSERRLATLRQREKEARRYFDNFDSLQAVWRGRESVRQQIATVRSVERLEAEREAGQEAGIVTREAAARKAIQALRILARFGCFPSAARDRMNARADGVERFMLPSLQLKLAEHVEAERAAECERIAERQRERERSEEERRALDDAAEADWLAGIPNPRQPHFDAPTGGAALRIVGDTLQTSHGADVPLSHAVKVFRFVKLCRERGEAWARNGKTIRVGHFQVDRIDAEGNFVAGCHSFTWPEVERVAKLAGLFDEAPSADALEPSSAAA